MPRLTLLSDGSFAVEDSATGETVVGHLEVEVLPPAGGQRRSSVQFVADTPSDPPPSGLRATIERGVSS